MAKDGLCCQLRLHYLPLKKPRKVLQIWNGQVGSPVMPLKCTHETLRKKSMGCMCCGQKMDLTHLGNAARVKDISPFNTQNKKTELCPACWLKSPAATMKKWLFSNFRWSKDIHSQKFKRRPSYWLITWSDMQGQYKVTDYLTRDNAAYWKRLYTTHLAPLFKLILEDALYNNGLHNFRSCKTARQLQLVHSVAPWWSIGIVHHK